MSIDLRISDKPYIADITFKDGTTRRVDYAVSCVGGGFFQFMESKEGTGPVTFISTDVIAIVEMDEAAQTVGGRQ